MDEYQELLIDNNNVLLGQSIADNVTIGGALSRKTQGWNPFYEKGVIYGQPLRGSVTGSIGGRTIVTCRDPSLLGNEFYSMDDTGRFYYYKNNIITQAQQDTTRTFTQGVSDMISFAGRTYATSTTNIGRLIGSNLGTFDQTWWTGTKGRTALRDTISQGGAHMMESVEDTLFIADGNYLHTIDASENCTYAAMSLPTNANLYTNITFMIRHPNGRDLIVFTSETINLGGTLNSTAKMYIIDCVNLEFRDEKTIDDQVVCACNVGGVIYVQYARNKLGYITDTGIAHLRDLTITSQSNLVSKGHMLNIGGHLWLTENNYILAYGDIGGGQKVFYYPYYNEIGANLAIDAMGYVGDMKVAMFVTDASTGTTNNLGTYDYKTISGLFRHYFERLKAPRKGWVRRVEVEHTAAPASCQLQACLVNDDGTLSSTIGINPVAGSTMTVWNFNKLTSIPQFYVQANGGTNNYIGFRQIRVLYEPGE